MEVIIHAEKMQLPLFDYIFINDLIKAYHLHILRCEISNSHLYIITYFPHFPATSFPHFSLTLLLLQPLP